MYIYIYIYVYIYTHTTYDWPFIADFEMSNDSDVHELVLRNKPSNIELFVC